MKKFIPLILFNIAVLASCSSQNTKQKKNSKPQAVIEKNDADSSKKVVLLRSEGFEKYADSLNALGNNVEVERFSLIWESDDRLCDLYEGSEGPMSYQVYRLANSKKLLAESEGGAFCQGDSDFNDAILFDMDGYYVMGSFLGMYQPSKVIFYTKGVITSGIDTPGEGEEFYAPRFFTNEGTGAHEAPKDPITARRDRVEIRKQGLEKLLVTLTDKDDLAEGKKTLQHINSLLDNKENWQWKNACLLRKAKEGETTLVSKMDVALHEKPIVSAAITGQISYYDGLFEVLETSADGEWYKLSGTYILTGKKAEGWVKSVLLVPGIFEK